LVDKVRDIVGLYLNPPHHAMVLCVDEKSQIQALSRSQPILPMLPGQAERRTHDYKRHGTTSLFAALDIATGSVIARSWPRHRAIEFHKFLNQIDRAVPADLTVHLVLGDYATHKIKEIRAWFLQHPRYQLHFTPTHSSWLNQVERWFALLSQRQIKRGSHYSVRELEGAMEFIDVHNEQSNPLCGPRVPIRFSIALDGLLRVFSLQTGRTIYKKLIIQETRVRRARSAGASWLTNFQFLFSVFSNFEFPFSSFRFPISSF
jgi:transposase